MIANMTVLVKSLEFLDITEVVGHQAITKEEKPGIHITYLIIN
jgi:hypothetical protein